MFDVFREADARIKRELEAQFWKTGFGKLVQRYRGIGRVNLADLLGVVSDVSGLGDLVNPVLREIRSIERYSRLDYSRYLRAFLRQLGPAGRLLDFLARGMTKRGKTDAISAAIELLRAFGFEVLPKPGLPLSPTELRRAVEAARQFLLWAESQEPIRERVPVYPTRTIQERLKEQGEKRTFADYILVPFGRGARRVPATHPLVTGEMVQVDSTNVHSIGYDLDTGILYVRFWHKRVRERRVYYVPGALYGYRGVTPEEFEDFLRAQSKGEWVWDHLRVRGTVSGHQKDYFLAGISGGYVPRKATMQVITDPETGERRLAEVFMPRTVLLGGRFIESLKPMEVVQVLKVVSPPKPGLYLG